MLVSGNSLNRRIVRAAYEDFFMNYGLFTDAVTINLKSRHPTLHIWWRDVMAEPTASWFLDRLNKKTFGRLYLGGHKRLAVAISYERGYLTGRPHFHLAVERPTQLSKTKFHQLIKDVFMKMDWGFGTVDICNFKSSKFLRYICKGDFEKFLLNACSKA